MYVYDNAPAIADCGRTAEIVQTVAQRRFESPHRWVDSSLLSESLLETTSYRGRCERNEEQQDHSKINQR